MSKSNNGQVIVLLIVLATIFALFFRVYIGMGTLGVSVVLKDGVSFQDTIINLNDIAGMPRLAVQMKHPAVFQQLVSMGYAKSNEEAMKEAQEEMQKQIAKAQEELQAQLSSMYGY